MNMLMISYNNIMHGLNKSINMTCVCPSTPEADRLYRNARKLWYVKGMATCKGVDRSIEVGPENLKRVFIRFRSLNILNQNSWRGFQGVFLLHPNLDHALYVESSRKDKLISELIEHNKRYNKKWQD